jgi:hypothetical protein
MYCKIEIPPNYSVEELPSGKAIALQGNTGRFLFNAIQSSNYIVVTCNVQINKALFAQNEYTALREFYTQVVAKQGEQIVLKKK